MYGIKLFLKNSFIPKHSWVASETEKYGTVMYEGYYCSLCDRKEYIKLYNECYVPRMLKEKVVLVLIEV